MNLTNGSDKWNQTRNGAGKSSAIHLIRARLGVPFFQRNEATFPSSLMVKATGVASTCLLLAGKNNVTGCLSSSQRQVHDKQ